MTVVVQIACDGEMPRAEQVAAWAGAALGNDPRDVCVRIVDEQEGAALNVRFRQRGSATNVLAFPAEPEDGPAAASVPLGDVAVCAPVVVGEAACQGKAVADHFAHLVMHGVLHLLGMAHDTTEQAAAMEAKETELLRGFGIGDPYAEVGA